MEIADETGLSTATRGWILLPPSRMASMASGMPWPRIRSDPKRAMSPMISAPMTGMMMMATPRFESAGDAGWMLMRPKKKRFVKNAMRRNSTNAKTAPTAPRQMAIAERMRRRGVVVKSPSSWRSAAPGRAAPSDSIRDMTIRLLWGKRALQAFAPVTSYYGDGYHRRWQSVLLKLGRDISGSGGAREPRHRQLRPNGSLRR